VPPRVLQELANLERRFLEAAVRAPFGGSMEEEDLYEAEEDRLAEVCGATWWIDGFPFTFVPKSALRPFWLKSTSCIEVGSPIRLLSVAAAPPSALWYLAAAIVLRDDLRCPAPA
jgi:hypothetical protein